MKNSSFFHPLFLLLKFNKRPINYHIYQFNRLLAGCTQLYVGKTERSWRFMHRKHASRIDQTIVLTFQLLTHVETL